MSNKILVLASTYLAYVAWINDRELSPLEAIFVNDMEKVQGLWGCRYVHVGWQKNSNPLVGSVEFQAYADSHNFIELGAIELRGKERQRRAENCASH